MATRSIKQWNKVFIGPRIIGADNSAVKVGRLVEMGRSVYLNAIEARSGTGRRGIYKTDELIGG
jgi:hypothetical protein